VRRSSFSAEWRLRTRARATVTRCHEWSGLAEGGGLAAQAPSTLASGALPEGIAISPDGKSVHAADHGSGSVSEYVRTP